MISVQQIIIFVVTLRPAPSGQTAFQHSMDRIIAGPVGGARFTIIYRSDALAVLRGAIIRIAGTTTDESLARHLTACLDGQAPADLDVHVRITTRS